MRKRQPQMQVRNFSVHPGQAGLPEHPAGISETGGETGGLFTQPRPGVLRLSSCRIIGNIDVYWDPELGIVVDGMTDDGELTEIVAEFPAGMDEGLW